MDGYLGGSKDGFAGPIEVLEGRSGRRLRSEGERARIAAESLVPGAKVSDVARRHDVTRWQVYDWRKKLTTGVLALPGEATREPLFAALVVEPPASSASRARHISSEKAKPLPVELVVDGAILRVRSDIDEVCLTGMIRAIRAASR